MTNTTKAGNSAERLVARELESRGYEILALNWRRRQCEIDVVAKKDRVINFVTPYKIKQLKFSAEVWIAEEKWAGDYRILAASVRLEGDQPIVEELVDID